MKLKCKYCNNDIKLQIKLAAEDFEDEHWNEVENQQGGTISDKVYDRKRDPLDWKIYYQEDTYRKTYPRELHKVPPEHDVGTSSVAHVVNDTLLVRCAQCKSIYAEVFDPSGMDVYHNDNYHSNPQTEPIAYQNESHPDFNKVRSSTDVDLDKVVDNVKKRLKNSKEQKNDDQEG